MSRLTAGIQRVYAEPLDKPGVVATATFAASAISSALAVAVNYTHVLSIPLMRQIIPFWYHYGGRWLWALPIIFGLASKRTLPRVMAGVGIATMGLWGAWSLLPMPMGSFFPLRIFYLVSALVLALPPLLRRLWDPPDAT
jgi:hypothetical protein